MGKWELDIYTETRSYPVCPWTFCGLNLMLPCLSLSVCVSLYFLSLYSLTPPLTHTHFYIFLLVWKVLCIGPWKRKAQWGLFLKQFFIIKVISNSNSFSLPLLCRQKLSSTWHAILPCIAHGSTLFIPLSLATLHPHPSLNLLQLLVTPLHLYPAHSSSSL